MYNVTMNVNVVSMESVFNMSVLNIVKGLEVRNVCLHIWNITETKESLTSPGINGNYLGGKIPSWNLFSNFDFLKLTFLFRVVFYVILKIVNFSLLPSIQIPILFEVLPAEDFTGHSSTDSGVFTVTTAGQDKLSLHPPPPIHTHFEAALTNSTR